MFGLQDQKLANALPDFLSENEEVLIVKRSHWISILPPIFFLVFFTLIGTICSFILFSFFPSTKLFLLVTALIVLSTATLTTKVIADWYFHLYIVTSQKILEVSHIPLFSCSVYDILLRQVRCTEIDVSQDGVLQEILNIGDVTITFDRPTHQEMFIFRSIKDPQVIGRYLNNALDISYQNMGEVWYKTKKGSYAITDDIFTRRKVGVS